MRELKFRCYSIPYARMYTPIASRIIVESENNSNDNIKIMQYTGLKDKNGVLIFEGDICKINYSLDSQKNSYCEHGIVLIEYHEGSYWAVNKEDKYHVIIDKQEVLEVIGNIYENPYLLKY